jgi:hypothetical protein
MQLSKQAMSRIALFVGVTAVLACPLFSQVTQPTPKLVAFATLLANPQVYLGQKIALHGFVDKSDAAIGGLKLIEAKSSGTHAKDQVSSVQATWANGARVVSVQYGQEAIAIGHIQIQGNVPILQIASIITDKDAIRRFIRPSERRPRPGDNLGHDAQPSKSISD